MFVFKSFCLAESNEWHEKNLGGFRFSRSEKKDQNSIVDLKPISKSAVNKEKCHNSTFLDDVNYPYENIKGFQDPTENFDKDDETLIDYDEIKLNSRHSWKRIRLHKQGKNWRISSETYV